MFPATTSAIVLAAAKLLIIFPATYSHLTLTAGLPLKRPSLHCVNLHSAENDFTQTISILMYNFCRDIVLSKVKLSCNIYHICLATGVTNLVQLYKRYSEDDQLSRLCFSVFRIKEVILWHMRIKL